MIGCFNFQKKPTGHNPPEMDSKTPNLTTKPQTQTISLQDVSLISCSEPENLSSTSMASFTIASLAEIVSISNEKIQQSRKRCQKDKTAILTSSPCIAELEKHMVLKTKKSKNTQTVAKTAEKKNTTPMEVVSISNEKTQTVNTKNAFTVCTCATKSANNLSCDNC